MFEFYTIGEMSKKKKPAPIPITMILPNTWFQYCSRNGTIPYTHPVISVALMYHNLLKTYNI